jgi:hypothetical protein
VAFPAAAGSGRLGADQQCAAADRGIPRFLRNALTAAAQIKGCSGSNAAAATQWLWQQDSGTGSDSGCLGFASVTRAVGVAGVGVAAKETIVRRGGSGTGRKGAAQQQHAPLRRGRQGAFAHQQQWCSSQWHSGTAAVAAAAAAAAQQAAAVAQGRQ